MTDEAGQVLGRDGTRWWSTGHNETLVRHSLDLRTLPRCSARTSWPAPWPVRSSPPS
ncbi:hypothetical protein ACQP00_20105 [Dactylosporangium sp. CS-047395]|uniref:hypothetical protein n=1 Tax=Dactylosporangium sp. CS-047395 TaxID=3239936 RepID=UPI003D8E42E1